MKQLKPLLSARREQLVYLAFGVLTTAVNYAVFFLFHALWGDGRVLAANLLAFAAAVAFAFVTNKIFVFKSRCWRAAVLLREAGSFLAARLFSFGLEEAGLYLAAYRLCLGRYALLGLDGVALSKLALSVLVVVLNYFFSKFLVFTGRK